MDAVQGRVAQSRFVQAGAEKIDVVQAGAFQVGAAQICAGQVDAFEIDGGKFGAREVWQLTLCVAPCHPPLNVVTGRTIPNLPHRMYRTATLLCGRSYRTTGPTDLQAVYERTEQTRVIGLPKVEIGLPGAAEKEINMQDAGRLDTLLGGHLHEIPEVYELASPVTHIHPGCPPTLLLTAGLDCITPPAAIRELHQKLVECGAPAINIVIPSNAARFRFVASADIALSSSCTL